MNKIKELIKEFGVFEWYVIGVFIPFTLVTIMATVGYIIIEVLE